MTAIHRYSSCLRTELFRLLITPRTYIAIFLVALTLLLSVIVSGIGFYNADSVYYFYLARYSHVNMLQILCLTFAFSVPILEDWNHKYTLPYVLRSGVGAYSMAKVTMCFIGSWSVTFTGIHLFLGLLSLKIPFISEKYFQFYAHDMPYGELVYSGMPYLYVFVTASIISATYAFWAVVGLLISTFCSNIFVTIGLPVLMSYYVSELTSALPIPRLLNITNISFCQDVGFGIAGSFIYSISFFALLSVLAGWLLYKRVKVRITGEIS